MAKAIDRSPRGDAGDVHDYVGRLREVRGEVRHRVAVGDVEGRSVDDSVADLTRGRVQAVSVDVGQDHSRSAADGGERSRAADPAGRTGDQACLAGDIHPAAQTVSSRWSMRLTWRLTES